MARLDARRPGTRTHVRRKPRGSSSQAGTQPVRVAPTPDDAPVEVSSPVCRAGEADDGYMGFLERDALVEQLNILLEAERAGAHVGVRLVADADDPELKALARVIYADETRWCRMLIGALKTLDAPPSQAVGAFYGKAMAISDVETRIAFVNRGQDWVVRKLTAMLPQVRNDALHASLREMLLAHERNIASAAATLDRRATKSHPVSTQPSKSES